MSTIASWFSDDLKSIVAGLATIEKSVTEIAKIYVNAINKDHNFNEYLTESLPSIPATFWRNLEKVGRNQLDGRIIGGAIPYVHRISVMSLSEQKRAIDGPLELLVKDGDKLSVKIDTITPDQAQQIFAKDHIRTLSEQKTWLESKSSAIRIRNNQDRPTVEIDKKRKEIVIGNIRITAAELADYLRKLME